MIKIGILSRITLNHTKEDFMVYYIKRIIVDSCFCLLFSTPREIFFK